jgi:heme-degrading monooxygenase HmoA
LVEWVWKPAKEMRMSVIVTVLVNGEPAKLEEHAAANPDAIRSISARAEAKGLIAHRFYGSDDGRVMVIDEWPDAESFQSFFSEAGPDIQSMMQQVGVTTEPQVSFWRKLETGDDVGWE